MSGLFESFGLKPGEGAQAALRRELERRRSLWDRTGYHYRGAGDFILQNGAFYAGRELPERYLHLAGEANECFVNSVLACTQDATLTYCEGVYSTGADHFTPHAWCVDPDGGVVEVTFPTRDLERYRPGRHFGGLSILPPPSWAYAGVLFPKLEFVAWHLDTHGGSMLDRPSADAERYGDELDFTEDHDWPILKVPFDPMRTTL